MNLPDFPFLPADEEAAILETPGVREALDRALTARPEELIDRGRFDYREM